MKQFEYDVNEVVPNLWLGNYKSACNKQFLNSYKIKNILTIMDFFDKRYIFPDINYLVIPLKDKYVCNDDMIPVFNKATDFIQKSLQNNIPILVHCKRGHHRSASLVVAYLIRYMKGDYVKSIEYINKLRPHALRKETCMGKHLFKYQLYLNNKSCPALCKQHGPIFYCQCNI